MCVCVCSGGDGDGGCRRLCPVPLNEIKENMENFLCVPNNDAEWDECVPQPVSRTTTSTQAGLSTPRPIPSRSHSHPLHARLSNINPIHCEIYKAKTSSGWQKIQFPSLVCVPITYFILFYYCFAYIHVCIRKWAEIV